MVLAGGLFEPLVLTQDQPGLQRDEERLLNTVACPVGLVACNSAEGTARALHEAGADYVVLGLSEKLVIPDPQERPGRERTFAYWGHPDRFRDPRFFTVEYEAEGYLVVRVKS